MKVVPFNIRIIYRGDHLHASNINRCYGASLKSLQYNMLYVIN